MYYHTLMRDVFVGSVCTIAIFFFTYRGYEAADNRICNFAGVLALIVALCPTNHDNVISTCLIDHLQNVVDISPRTVVLGRIHLAAAIVLFIVLAYISFFIFTKHDPKKGMSAAKIARNKIFKLCGIIILGSLLSAGAVLGIMEDQILWMNKYDPVFWLEAVMLFAFGFSWLTKGDIVFVD